MDENQLLAKMEPQIEANRRKVPFPRLVAEGILHADKPMAEKESVLHKIFGIPLEDGQLTLKGTTTS
jgi:hypothetical protein